MNNATLRSRWDSHDRALRHLPSPVSVLTVVSEGRRHGTTVSTVVRISHRPHVLSVSLKTGSLLSELAVTEGRFAINVLSAGQSGLARKFARSRRPKGNAQFEGVPWHPSPYSGAPLFPDTLAFYDCRVLGRFPVGDHEVLVGAVVQADCAGGDPLISRTGELFAGPLIPVERDGVPPAVHPSVLVAGRKSAPLAKENVPS
ncbi:flavin reductase family protein [Streptomyces sp. NPDC102409]|uniref:flavin reductase family protein n=1 Tax=Streptomyces sp. NPDC102409 TaxID=3366172 RepID=UPI0038057187